MRTRSWCGSCVRRVLLPLAIIGCAMHPRRGGTRFTIAVTTSDHRNVEDVATSLRERFAEKGDTAIAVAATGDHVTVELPATESAHFAVKRDLVARTAHLELRAVDDDAAYVTTLAELAASHPELVVTDRVIRATSQDVTGPPAWAATHCHAPASDPHCLLRGEEIARARRSRHRVRAYRRDVAGALPPAHGSDPRRSDRARRADVRADDRGLDRARRADARGAQAYAALARHRLAVMVDGRSTRPSRSITQ